MSRPFVVTGFAYAFPHYRRVFEREPWNTIAIFLIPSPWPSRDRSTLFRPSMPDGFLFRGIWCRFWGGKSVLSGLFKGWMPTIPWHLLRARFAGGRLVYACSEPNLLSTLYTAFWARLFGYRVVLYSAQNIMPEDRLSGLKRRLSDVLVRLNLRLASGVLTCNVAAGNLVRRYRSSISTEVIPFAGVETGPQRSRCDTDAPLVLFAGHLNDNRKGADILVRSFALLSAIPNARLLVVGSGIEESHIDALIRELGIGTRVTRVPWMPHERFLEALTRACVFVYPSRRRQGWEEQFGFAMAEAQAVGVPVIATDTGSIREVVEDGVTGLLVPPDDPSALAGAIKSILSNPSRRIAMADAAYERAVRLFTHDAVAQRIFSFMQQL